MNTTKTALAADAQESTAVTATGIVRSPLTLMRRISDRVARVSSVSTEKTAPTTCTLPARAQN